MLPSTPRHIIVRAPHGQVSHHPILSSPAARFHPHHHEWGEWYLVTPQGRPLEEQEGSGQS